MEKAKQTISGFMSHNNEHKTIVDQDQRGAITEEHIRPERHEEVTTAIDKEIHQDHHQTILQPIKHSERLEEKHTHNAVPVQHKTFEHDKPDEARNLVDADAAKYRDTSTTHDTIKSTSQGPVVQGEHIHHHLHQHVQPVIQKDTIAPEVVHTTIPIHETHHAPTVHHGTTTMPAKTLQEFEAEHGGLIKGKNTATVGEFDGCAKSFAESDRVGLGSRSEGAGIKPSTTTSTSTSTTSNTTANQGGVKSLVSSSGGVDENKSGLSHSSNDYKVANQAANRAYNNAAVPRSSGAVAPGIAAPGGGSNLSTTNSGETTASGRKVSLVDKLNPFKDADGDGKKGLMS